MSSAAAGWDGNYKPQKDLSLSSLVGLCRRHVVLIAIWVLVGMASALALIMSLQPRYRAEAMLMLDSRVQHLSNLESVISSPFTTSDPTPIMSSEVQVLESPELARRVIEQLDLEHKPSFQSKQSALDAAINNALDHLRSLCHQVLPASCALSTPTIPGAKLGKLQLINGYLRRLSVFNDGKSLTILVSFEDGDPETAALVANTHAQLYVADQRAFKRQAAERGLAWIERELSRLGTGLDVKEREMAQFREVSGLIAAQGSTLTAQQVSEIGTQRALAQAELAQRLARLASSNAATKRGAAAVQSDVLNSPLIQRLREQQSVAQQELAALEKRLGSDHPSLQQMRARIDEVALKVASETSHVIASSNSDVEMAQRRLAILESALAKLQQELIEQHRAASRLAEMERDVSAARTVYQNLLSRRQELAAQAGTEDADARLVSPAVEPLLPFFPKRTMLLSVALLLTGVSGVGLAFVVDRPERGIEIPSRLDGVVGTASGQVSSPLPFVMQSLPFVTRTVRGERSLPDYMLDAPKSEFAEAVRGLRGDVARIGRGTPPQVIAITSALPEEGKTTVALALARSMAARLNVLLIDGDLRRPKISSMIGVHSADRGLLSVLGGRHSLEDAIIQDPRSALSILTPEQRVAMPQDWLGSVGFVLLLNVARRIYHAIIIDTPPQAIVSDAFLIAPRADATILTVRSRSTPASIVRLAWQEFYKRDMPLAGMFLNAVDQRAVARNDPDMRSVYKASRSHYMDA